jgi:putative ABC transport system permease protein
VWQLLVAACCAAAVVATVVLAPQLPPLFALLVGILLPEVVVIGLAGVGGLVFPALAGLLGRVVVRHDVAARLARDHVRASVRMPAALAAPVVAISAVAGSMILTLSFTADWTTALDREQLAAPLVVDGVRSADAAAVAGDPTVAVADVRRQLAGRGGGAEVVDVDAAVAARGLHAVRGSLDDLHGTAVAVTETWTADAGRGLGDTAVVQVGGRRVTAPIVAVVADAPDLYADLIVPDDLPGVDTAARPTGTVFVLPQVAPGPTAAALEDALAGTGAGVLTADAWVDAVAADTRHANNLGLWVFLGPAGAYAAIGIVNAVLIGASQRREQIRAARLLGATPGQVRRMALWEAGLIGAAALLVGGGVTGFVGWVVRQAIVRDVADAPLTVPWLPLGGVALACALLVLAAAATGSRAAARS